MVLEHALEQPLPVLERDVEQAPTVEIQQVEHLVHEPGGLLVAELGLEEAEIGSAVLVDRDDLTIEHGLFGLDPSPRRTEEAREVGGGVVQVPGQELDRAVIDDRLDSKPVPLDLEQPVVVIERLARERREHRLDLLGQRRALGTAKIDLGGRRRSLADPDRIAIGLDLVVGPAGLDALWMVLSVPACDGRIVGLVDEEPLVAVVLEWPVAPAAAGPDDREPTLQLLAVQRELELA